MGSADSFAAVPVHRVPRVGERLLPLVCLRQVRISCNVALVELLYTSGYRTQSKEDFHAAGRRKNYCLGWTSTRVWWSSRDRAVPEWTWTRTQCHLAKSRSVSPCLISSPPPPPSSLSNHSGGLGNSTHHSSTHLTVGKAHRISSRRPSPRLVALTAQQISEGTNTVVSPSNCHLRLQQPEN